MFLLADTRFEILRQGIELQFPERAILLDPRGGILHGLGLQPAAMHAAIDFTFEQARGFQDAHVLRDGGQRNAERLRKLCDHGRALCEAGQDGAAGGIGERSKRGIQGRR